MRKTDVVRLLRVGFLVLYVEVQRRLSSKSARTSLFLSLSLSHTHTHTRHSNACFARLTRHPSQITDKEGNTRPFWTFGNTLFFGKDNTTEKLLQSHQRVVAALVIDWSRYHIYFAKYKDFIWAQRRIVSIWKRKLEMRRLAKIEAHIIEAQAMLRAVNALNETRKRRKIHVAAKLIQDAYRPYRVYSEWKGSIRDLGRIEEVKQARLSCQKAWRNYSQYQTWAQALKERIHYCATLKLDEVVTDVVDSVSKKLARHQMQSRIRRKLKDLRDRVRAQAHIRASISRFQFQEAQRRLEIIRQASYKAEGVYAMVFCRLNLRRKHMVRYVGVRSARTSLSLSILHTLTKHSTLTGNLQNTKTRSKILLSAICCVVEMDFKHEPQTTKSKTCSTFRTR